MKNIKYMMQSENLIALILNYLNFNNYSKFLDLSSYNLDYSKNDKITFEDFRSFLPLAIGINLFEFKNKFIYSLTHIQFLNISKCNISILPKELFINVQLKSINCSHNNLTVIPTEIKNCKKLENFDCNNNQITIIPTEIGNCINLQIFDCGYNQMTVIPSDIGKLINLRIFNCCYNKIPLKVALIMAYIQYSYISNSINELCKE